MSALDQSVLSFFAENRLGWLNFLMLIATYAGGYLVVGGLTFLSGVSFYIHKHANRALPLFISVAGSAAMVLSLKNFFYRTRPLAAFYPESTYSFPSGHAALAMALYGFFIYFIWRHDKHPLKNPLIILLSALILLVGISRLYLGVHYLSDVLAGYAIGLLWISLAGLASKSKTLHLRGGGRL